MIKAFRLIAMAAILALSSTSCLKEQETSITLFNYMTHGFAGWQVNTLIIDQDEPAEGDESVRTIVDVYSRNFSYDDEENVIEGKGERVRFILYTETYGELDEGTYSFSYTGSTSPGSVVNGTLQYGLDTEDGSVETTYFFTDLEMEVKHDGDQYVIDFIGNTDSNDEDTYKAEAMGNISREPIIGDQEVEEDVIE